MEIKLVYPTGQNYDGPKMELYRDVLLDDGTEVPQVLGKLPHTNMLKEGSWHYEFGFMAERGAVIAGPMVAGKSYLISTDIFSEEIMVKIEDAMNTEFEGAEPTKRLYK
ncbi:MAG: hypothetical protein ABIH52_02020 [Candidatus Aenigmatarchaeota archaeon]|nr:hypothetical protein [Nanoarchaeota archaeon]